MSKLIQSSLLSIWFALQSNVAVADPLCWLRSESPSDAVITGPIQLGPEWKKYKLVKPFKLSQHVYEIEFKKDFSSFFMKWFPRSIGTGEIYVFEAKIRNSKLGWLNLRYSASGTSVFKSQTYKSVGFTKNPDKMQGFYPEGSVIEEVHVRASHNVKVEHIRWTASGYWRWPCRKWSEVPASEFIVPER
jgi:hypothetical protein